MRTPKEASTEPEPTEFDWRQGALAAVFAVPVLFLLPCVIAWATYQGGLVWLRLRWQLLVGAGVALQVVWWGLDRSSAYWIGHRELWRAVVHHDVKAVVADRWVYWLFCELPTSVAFGVFLGALYSAWRWLRRPAWEDDDRRPYPWVWLKRRRTIASIQADTDGPDTGVTIGVEETTGDRVTQSDAEGGVHTLVTGGSGTGKTTLILTGMRDVIRLGRGLVVVDLKGSDDIPDQVAEWCDRYGRVFHHWTFHDPRTPYAGAASAPSFYEPVGRGDATRRAGLVLATREWSIESDHYKKIVEGFLQVAFSIAAIAPPRASNSIADVTAMCTDPEYLLGRTQEAFSRVRAPGGGASGYWLQHWESLPAGSARSMFQIVATFVTLLRGGTFRIDETVRRFGQSLTTFSQSVAGHHLTTDPLGLRDIDLSRAAREGQVVVFSLNASNYPELAASIAAMVIQDLKTVSAELRNDPVWHGSTKDRDRMHVYVDEFGALKVDNTKTLLQQVRDARISVTLSTQSVADLTYHSPAFKDVVLNTVGSFVILRPNTTAESEELAGLTGGAITLFKQTGIQHRNSLAGINRGATTGQGSLRHEMGTTVPAHALQDLRIGEAVYISSGAGSRRVVPVTVIREDTNPETPHPSLGLRLQAPIPRTTEVALVASHRDENAAISLPGIPQGPAAVVDYSDLGVPPATDDQPDDHFDG